MPSDRGTHHDAPTSLRMIPAVVLGDPSLAPVVAAGARRAAGGAVVDTLDGRSTIAAWSEAVAEGAEVLVLCAGEAGAADTLARLQAAGARGLPALALDSQDGTPRPTGASIELLSRADLADLNVPVPMIDDDVLRRGLWDALRGARIEERHHLVEVDGAPALVQLTEDGAAPRGGWSELAAGAAGVLAGRLVASNRRWRAQLDT